MSATEGAQAGGTVVVERSASHFLTRDADGWALWSVDQDDDLPLLEFAADPAGEARARAAFAIRTRETRRVLFLARVALAAGAIALVVKTAEILYQHFGGDPSSRLIGDGLQELPRKVEILISLGAVYQLAFAVFQVVVGLFLLAWLQRRWRREG